MHRVKKMPYKDFDQIRAFCEALRNPKFREITNIGSVVFDEFNTMFDMNIEAITNLRSVQSDKYKDPDTPEWPEYNTAKMHMINLMNDVLYTGYRFFFYLPPSVPKENRVYRTGLLLRKLLRLSCGYCILCTTCTPM